MDVVFNHTAEGNENGPILSFRGVDNSVFYMLAPKVYFVPPFHQVKVLSDVATATRLNSSVM